MKQCMRFSPWPSVLSSLSSAFHCSARWGRGFTVENHHTPVWSTLLAMPWWLNRAARLLPRFPQLGSFKFLTSRLSATITSSTYFVVFRVSLLYCKKKMKIVFWFCSQGPLDAALPQSEEVLARGGTQLLRLPKVSLHANVYCIPSPHESFPFICYNRNSLCGTYEKNIPGFDHSKQGSGAKSPSTFQLSAVETFELSFLAGEYHL